MNQLLDMLRLQGTMFCLLGLGILVKKIGLVSKEGQKNITDLVLYVILPANILQSFLKTPDSTLAGFIPVLLVSICIQAAGVLFGHVLYGKRPEDQRKCLQYGTICSNAGFLGNPMAEGMFGTAGLAYASVYLIPLRIMMWTRGVSLYNKSAGKRDVIIKTVTHPCIIATVLGIVMMLAHLSLPSFLGKAVQYVGTGNTFFSLMVVGMVLADMDWRSILDKDVLFFSFFRLIVLPLGTYLLCLVFGFDSLVTGICVLLCAMPAGSTVSIFASKYSGDASFATKIVVGSTLLSILTTAVWSFVLL